MSTTKCILINPWTKTVDEAMYDPQDVHTLRTALTCMSHYVEHIAVRASFPNTDNLVIEHPDKIPENALIPYFQLGSIMVQGCGVILGVDGDKWIAPKFKKADLQDRVRF